jgi:hypothetical protein
MNQSLELGTRARYPTIDLDISSAWSDRLTDSRHLSSCFVLNSLEQR